jgi:hypothetical protein
VDGVSLQWLEGHYFSKTREQDITGEMTFTQSANFNKDLYVHKAYVGRYVGNLNINDFAQRVLLDGPNQNVVEYLVFNEIHAKGKLDIFLIRTACVYCIIFRCCSTKWTVK